VTRDYFLEQLRVYSGYNSNNSEEAKEQLKQMNERLRTAYSDPQLLSNLLVRFGFFNLIETEEQRIKHNEVKKMLYDMGIIRVDNPESFAELMIREATIPRAYLGKDDMEV